MHNKKIAVLGGDMRNLLLARLLNRDNHFVKIFGFQKAENTWGLQECSSIEDAIKGADCVISPIPFSQDGSTLYMPLSTEIMKIEDFFKGLSNRTMLITGRLQNEAAHFVGEKEIEVWDVLEREEFAVMNAVPTAEGAISIALNEMPITLHRCKALIIGNGRIGKILAKMLYGFGALVNVVARRHDDLAWIESYGYSSHHVIDMEDILEEMDVIFNTVPSMMLNRELLKKINPECPIIDLASKPGGVDFDAGREFGLNVIWALSLPAKIAPVTAAKIVKDAVYNIWKDRGE